ncbi:MAG: acylneuraminate cytidylyltransferase family protein [Patescibacteria group bacterium]|nr:acylneuraminate cytidylyltransferase family protein [Patescibacteria group bacterium]
MYQGKKILGITMARGGSKSISRKNIKPLGGKPLIAYAIKAALNSKYLTKYIVSSDDAEIIEVAKSLGAEAPFVRPVSLAQDDTPDIPVLQHAVNWLKENLNEEYDYIMMLHPTAPLRLGSHLDDCIKKIVDSGADSVMAMKELPDFSLKKLKKIEDDLILPLLEEEGAFTARRQDAPAKVYKRNCAIYLTRRDLIMAGNLFGRISRPYIMSEEWSVDINGLVDFEIAEFKIKKLRAKGYDI